MGHLVRTVAAVFVVVFLTTGSSAFAAADHNKEEGGNRRARIFNLLQVIRFQNDPCMGSGNMNGTCYTEAECDDRGGVNSGSCASGFGVCCVFTLGCGQMSNENCTFFNVNDATAGACSVTICPCNDNICQLRLDFINFVISGPSTVTASMFKTLNGVESIAGSAKESSQASNCLADTFSVTSPGSASVPPTICGMNTGEHMYVQASDSCNDLIFQVGSVGGTARNWNIKVTQFGCGFENLAPPGCTQYFFGANMGTAMSFNFNNGMGQHLANQNQAICVRRENGNCRLCFTQDAMNAFDISGKSTKGKVVAGEMCCNYGTNGQGTDGFDCVSLPGAVAGNLGKEKEDRNCGRAFGPTRCTLLEPFMLRFLTDSFEFVGNAAMSESAQLDNGFSLNFFMDAINCNVFDA